jgi:hypothetical protein
MSSLEFFTLFFLLFTTVRCVENDVFRTMLQERRRGKNPSHLTQDSWQDFRHSIIYNETIMTPHALLDITLLHPHVIAWKHAWTPTGRSRIKADNLCVRAARKCYSCWTNVNMLTISARNGTLIGRTRRQCSKGGIDRSQLRCPPSALSHPPPAARLAPAFTSSADAVWGVHIGLLPVCLLARCLHSVNCSPRGNEFSFSCRGAQKQRQLVWYTLPMYKVETSLTLRYKCLCGINIKAINNRGQVIIQFSICQRDNR